MALSKQKDLATGFSCNYARVRFFDVSLDDAAVRVSVGYYKDQAARSGGSEPATQSTHVFRNATAIVEAAKARGDVMGPIYAALKALPEFEGATDC